MPPASPSDLEKPAIDPSTTLSVAEATRRLGVGRARVYQLIEAGALDTVSTQPVRITLDSLERRRSMATTLGAPLASLSAWAVLALAGPLSPPAVGGYDTPKYARPPSDAKSVTACASAAGHRRRWRAKA